MDNDVEYIWRELVRTFPFEYKEGLILKKDWRQFKKGTHADEIWTWFDDEHSKGVGYLADMLGKRENKKGEDENMDTKYNFTITNAVSSTVTAKIKSTKEYNNDVDALIDAQQMCEERHIKECDIDVNVKYKTDDNETGYKRYYHYHYKNHQIES